MKKIIRISVFFFLMLGFCSCKEDPIMIYSGGNRIHFKNKSENSVYRFSFATTPGKEEYTMKIPVSLIGTALEQDREYSLEVVNEGDLATTLSSSLYSMSHIFHKGVYEDSLAIKFVNAPELGEEKRLFLKIIENDYFKVGIENHQTALIYVTNKLAQPDWWNEDMAKVFLGPYSDIKYRHFIIATGISDLSGMKISEIKAYVVQFVNYLIELDNKGDTLFEADGITKVLDTVSYAKLM